MVIRLYAEKKPAFADEAAALLSALRGQLGLSALRAVRLLNRYDVEGVSAEALAPLENVVFAEPPVDDLLRALPEDADCLFGVEALPGQFDQRADSCESCLQAVLRQETRPSVRCAKVYALYGKLDAKELAAVKRHLINPVESREASLAQVATLALEHPTPEPVRPLEGFTALDDAALSALIRREGLAMELADLRFLRDYFAAEHREPTQTELRMLDAYWSDHCRHNTFLTELTELSFEDKAAEAAYARYLEVRRELGRTAPVCLMDMGTLAAKYLKKQGKLTGLFESEENNACTVRVRPLIDGKPQDWLLLFKNETHNHPTEIEPFGGAATCIGGAIRDPLSGRGYVYHALRLTGAGDPRTPLSETLPGKLPQRTIVTSAAAGFASYGNQIGLATGLVDELYHPGYVAKRMEVGAVVGAAPAAAVHHLLPAPGDVVLLIGGRTGRDGCGGATGSSKSHSTASLSLCGAEVQKGNAPEERKLQRLMRNPAATSLIKRCNDFGAGGVSVAVGELADGLLIDLAAVPKKYDGLSATELAISESQERMAVLLAEKDVPAFLALCESENLEASRVAVVTEEPRLVMKLGEDTIADISREFLNSGGVRRKGKAVVAAAQAVPAPQSPPPGLGRFGDKVDGAGLAARLRSLAGDLTGATRRGLVERFDAAIGTGSVLMPYGGRRQRTPMQAMAAKLPLLSGETDACSLMSWGFDPFVSAASPYCGGYLAVVDSLTKLTAVGGNWRQSYLSFQEYFERLGEDPKRWGKPVAAVLGAFSAQLDFGVGAIGGKDSMSGSFEKLDVPPTLISFAAALGEASHVLSPEFKRAGSRVVLLAPPLTAEGLPEAEKLKENFCTVQRLNAQGKLLSAWAVTSGGVAEGILKMSFGNALGFAFDDALSLSAIFAAAPGALLLELAEDAEAVGSPLGLVTAAPAISFKGEAVSLEALEAVWEAPLASVYPLAPPEAPAGEVSKLAFAPAAARLAPAVRSAQPRVLIPVFPGTNCEYDTAAAFERAGAKAEILVVRNLTAAAVAESIEALAASLANSQILALPGGFSAGDEPEGSGKFIAALLRAPAAAEAIAKLLARDGLILGVCNGFQALIKLGLVPYGEIRPITADCPTLTYNRIGRHQSRLVRTRVASTLSPWLMYAEIGDVYTAPVSHGEGRFVCSEALLAELTAKGQLATQYVSEDGVPSMSIDVNPNGSAWAVEGITSADGRVFGRMAHAERSGAGLYKNVPHGNPSPIFRGAVDYYKL